MGMQDLIAKDRRKQAEQLTKVEQIYDPEVQNPEETLRAALQERDAAPKKRTHRVTKPWQGKNSPYRKNYFGTAKTRPGFKVVWPHVERVREMLDKGYTLCDPSDYGELTTLIPGEEGQLEPGIIRRREHVAMEIPIDEYHAQKEAKNRVAKEMLEANNRATQEAASAVGTTFYNPVSEK